MPRTYFEILWLLHNAPDGTLRMSDLAAATGTQPSRITHAVSRLEQAGQVRRELCTDDRRGWFTILTDEGVAALGGGGPALREERPPAFGRSALKCAARAAQSNR
jgi:DNA-binding MarR family transcriptional regulator